MVSYQRFKDLPVWQVAATLYEHIEKFLITDMPRLSYSFRDQLERATLSISNNIAEDFERGTTRELLAFIYIARGSAGVVRSMLIILFRRSEFSNLKSQISNLMSLAESCSRQLRAWADALQNSEIKGFRDLNDKTRRDYQQKQMRKQAETEHQAMLEQYLPPDHLLRRKECVLKENKFFLGRYFNNIINAI